MNRAFRYDKRPFLSITRASNEAVDLPASTISALPKSRLAAVLDELRATLHREIPISSQMGIEVEGWTESGLRVVLPLEKNRNHQQTAFAGSLNALCTLAGWSTVFLITRCHDLGGGIVIRRSAIKYLLPVTAASIPAICRPVTEPEEAHFIEMLREKGQAKLDLDVEVTIDAHLAVAFHGSYVVLNRETPAG